MTGANYDDGYKRCPCFWGDRPGSYVDELLQHATTIDGWRILDAGCGEGKNAAYLAGRGAKVIATEKSPWALANAKRHWSSIPGVMFLQADVTSLAIRPGGLDAVVAYGLLHCLSSPHAIRRCVESLKNGVRPGGYHVVCTFNERRQEFGDAHPSFNPTLLPHEEFVEMYSDWELLKVSDQDLGEAHPDNRIWHVHSMTRILARRPEVA